MRPDKHVSPAARRTLHNTALLISFEIANPLLSILLVGTMTRTLGAEGTGAYNLLLNYFFVAHSFTSLGLNSLVTREVSRDHHAARRHLCSSISLGLPTSLLMAVAVVLVIHLAGYSPEVVRGAGWVALSLLPSIIILYSESIFIAFEKVRYMVGLTMLENAAKVVTGLWLLHHGYGVVALMSSFAGFRFLNLLLNLTVFHFRIAPLRWDYDWEIMQKLIRNVPVFGTIFIVAALYLRTDVFMLSKLGTLAAVGYYTTGYRLFAIAQVVPKSFNTSIYPVFSKLFHESQDSYQKASGLAVRYILVVLLPIAAGIGELAEPVVRLLFGPGFEASASVLKVVIWTLVPYGIVRVLASLLFASNRQHIDLKVNLMGLATNVLLNVLLIPRFGILGCAWAALLSMCCFLGYQCFFLRGEVGPVLRQAEIVRPGLVTVALTGWLYVTPGLALWARILGGAAVYVVLLLALRVVRLVELRALMPQRFALPLPEEPEA
ncbi:MAG TPA: flippase [Candidatus Polarisedimenticolia bacterium]|nr:flippase [Candidatus Polarisedimenticolia bacterium]